MKKEIIIKEIKLKESKALKKIKKYIVTVEGAKLNEYTFLEDTIIKHMIFKDKVFSENEFEEILEDESKNNSLNLALNFISYQFRSEKELVKHLKEKGVTTENIASTISKLKTLGYVDDVKFAKWVIESYNRKLKGPNYCYKVLCEKNISQDIINLALEEYTLEMELSSIEKIIEKELKTLQKYPAKKQKMKLINKLSVAGFKSNAINLALSKVDFKEDIENELNKNIEKLMKKYDDLDEKTKYQKIVTSLLNKGYSYNQIKNMLNE